jgi:hypothetical protein
MRIIIVRSGGFTGIPVEITVDENELQPNEADQLHSAVQESHFFSLPTRLPDHSGGADTFNYTITVEDLARTHTIVGPESALPPPLDELVQKFMRRRRE